MPRTDRGRKLGRRCCAQAVEAKTSFGQISPSQRSFGAEPGQGRNADRGEPEGPVRKTGRASQARTPDRIQACLRTPLPCRLTGPATSNGFQSASGSDPASTSVVPSGLIWAGKLDDPGQQHPVRSAVPERRTEGRQGTEPDPHTPPRCGTTPTHRPVERPGSGIKREIKPTCCRIKIAGRPKPPRLRIIPLRWDAAARPHRRPAVRRLRQPC